MNRRIKAVVSLVLCLLLAAAAPLCTLAAAAQEQENVLVIRTTEDFLEFADNCRINSYSMGLAVKLEADIDLSGESFGGVPVFLGSFDGGGHTVSGLSITESGSVYGLFRYLPAGASVCDLRVEGTVSPGGSHSMVGGIAGSNAGLITGCTFSGSVTGADSVGGIAGRNELSGIIDGCASEGSVHADHFVGGIAGENLGVIRSCVSYAQTNATAEHNSVELSDITVDSLLGSENIATTTDIGGIAGMNTGVVRECENRGTVGYAQMGYNVGGIAGRQVGYITGCANYADVYGRKEVGGIVGQMEPSTVIKYSPDTLQVLQRQLGTLSGMLDSTVASARSGIGDMQSGAENIRDQVGSAIDAVEQLRPGGDNDSDSMDAALSNLSGAFSSITGSLENMANSGNESANELSGNMQEIIAQFRSIGATVGSAGMGGTVTDVSDEDTDEDITSKVEQCINYASVQADLNAGGIVGAISLENDLDPENDLTVTGNTSMNFDCETRAVVRECENAGSVEAKRYNAGGIAGWMTLGLVRECVNTASIGAQSADYVGGIVGQSIGYVRMCSAKCVLYGSTGVGGIAGQASVLSDCRSSVIIQSGSERLGAVLGYYDGALDLAVGGTRIENNYYLKTETDIGAVDGISYSGAAQALDADEFFALEDIPEVFGTVTVRFIFEDGEQKLIVLTPGEQLKESDIPALPEKHGYYAVWEGFDSFERDSVFYDASFTALYTPFDSTVRSDLERENGRPVLLALGAFTTSQPLGIRTLDNLPVSEHTAIEGWELTLPECDSQIELRYAYTGEYAPGDMIIMVRGANGEWREVEFTVDGSYLIFPVSREDDAFGAYYAPDTSVLIISVICSAAVLVIFAVVCTAVGKRARRNADAAGGE